MQRVLIVDDDKAFVDGMGIALRSKERMIYRAYWRLIKSNSFRSRSARYSSFLLKNRG